MTPESPDLAEVQSVFSLQELEPSPVDEEPYENEKGYFEPEPSPSPPPLVARATTLGLSGHGPVYWRKPTLK